jgi:mannan endo-1,4-beta-mannosidase
MIAMAENDCFSTVENLTSENAGWLYFCTWYDGGSDNNNFLTNPVFNTKEDTIAMYQSEYCITLDELPKDLYSKEGITPPDPSKTTTTTTTTSDPNVTTTTTTAPYKFEIQKKSVTIPEKPDNAVERDMIIEISGSPNASIGAAVGYGTTAANWKNIDWSGNADKNGNLTVTVDITDIPETFNTCEVQVWWSNVWNAATETAIDKDYKIESCTIEYRTGGDVVEATEWGDANCDGSVDMADVVIIMQSLANPNKYGLNGTDERHITELGLANADVATDVKGVTSNDALKIQEFLLGKIKTLDPKA